MTRRAGFRWCTRWKTPPPGRPASARKTIPSKPWFRSAGSRPRIPATSRAKRAVSEEVAGSHTTSSPFFSARRTSLPLGAWTVTSSRLPLTRCLATTAPEGSISASDPRSPTDEEAPQGRVPGDPRGLAHARGRHRLGRAEAGGRRARLRPGRAKPTRKRFRPGWKKSIDRARTASSPPARMVSTRSPPYSRRSERYLSWLMRAMMWFCTVSSAFSCPKRTLAPRAPVGLEVALHDVLVVAQALGVVLGAALARVGQVRAEAPGPEGLDRLEEEEEGDAGVDEEVEAEEGPQPLRQVVDDVGAGGEEEEGDVQRAHDHEGEACLAVGELDEVLGLLERVHEGPVALPGVERPDGLGLELGLLPAPFRVVCLRPGHAGRERSRRFLLGHRESIAGPTQMKPLTRGQISRSERFGPRAIQIERPFS